MKPNFLLICLLITLTGFGQTLTSFSVNMQPDSLCYLSISKSKAYTTNEAAKIKSELDFGIFQTIADKTKITEWYNLKNDNEKVPASLTGTNTKIVAISFDREQFDKCKTTADLKRMTGYLTNNSLSHFAVIRNSDDYYQRCFIIENVGLKRALFFVTDIGNDTFKIDVKAE